MNSLIGKIQQNLILLIQLHYLLILLDISHEHWNYQPDCINLNIIIMTHRLSYRK